MANHTHSFESRHSCFMECAMQNKHHTHSESDKTPSFPITTTPLPPVIPSHASPVCDSLVAIPPIPSTGDSMDVLIINECDDDWTHCLGQTQIQLQNSGCRMSVTETIGTVFR